MILSQRTQSRKAGLNSLSSERSEAKSLRLCAFARDPDEAGHDDCVRTLCGQPHDLSLAKSAKAQSRPETISQREAKSLRLCAFARDPDEAGHDDCVRTLCGQPHDLSLAKSAKAQSRPETISQREAKSLRLCTFARDLDQAGHIACVRFLPRAGLSEPLLYNKGRDLRDIAKNLQKLLQVSKIRAIFAKIFP